MISMELIKNVEIAVKWKQKVIFAIFCVLRYYGHELAYGTVLYSVLARIVQTSIIEMLETAFSYKGAQFLQKATCFKTTDLFKLLPAWLYDVR